MYYEPYRGRRPARRRRRRRHGLARFVAKLLITALLLAALAAGALYVMPVSLLAVEPEGMTLSLTDGLPGDRINVLLLGTDLMSESRQRSDTLIIATLGSRTVRLTSVLRDTVVDIPGHGSGKVNAAFAYGGAELAMRTLNEAFDLNIMYYVRADFAALVRAVDAIGGVDIDVTRAELEQINETVAYFLALYPDHDYPADMLYTPGLARLNGLQALSYARIRKIDSDYRRASRQRTLLTAMLARIRANIWNPAMLARLAREVLGGLDTNLSPLALISLGEKALLADDLSQMRLPAEGTYTDDGSSIRIDSRDRNIAAFRAFAYP